MAKKSLKKSIDDLVNALGRAKKPTFAQLKSELVSLGNLAQELEDGQALSEKEAAISALKKENENLKVELQSAKAELETFRTERKKQEEGKKRENIPDIQLQILRELPSEHEGNWPRIAAISSAVGIPVDETEIHLDRLEKAQPPFIKSRNRFRHTVWHRTMRGNEYVLAKRLAAEEQTPPRKYPNLPIFEEAMLAMMVGEDEGVNERLIHQSLEDEGVKITLGKVKWILETKLKGFAIYDPEEATYGAGNTWFITNAGREYFAERDKL